MKKYILFSIAALAALVSCKSEKSILDTEKDRMADRQAAVKDLDVKYSLDSIDTKTTFTFDNKSREVSMFVEINDANLRWNVESNREWCKVMDIDHKGSGMLNLKIDANEDFEDREPATLTFVAGEFRGFKFVVNQEGSVFLLSQPYFVVGKKQSAGSVMVTVPKENGALTQWEISTPDWITATKGSIVSEDANQQVVKVDFTAAANNASSRYGIITLTKSGAVSNGEIAIYQFGTEYQWDADGNISFPGGESKFSLVAPRFCVDGIVAPEYAITTYEEDDDQMTLTIYLEENYSDCSELRFTDIQLVLSNAVSTKVSLPRISQDFVAAHGLVTSKGLSRFAAAVAAGNSTADWEENGVVILKGNIDMTDVTDWKGIGSEAKPFAGVFDGKGYRIDNLKSAPALFNVCDKATIRNVVLGSKSGIYVTATSCAGGIANVAKQSTIQNCKVEGSVELAGSSASGINAIGGIVGYADSKTAVIACACSGNVNMAIPSGSLRGDCGGIAGNSEGDVNNCEFSGTLTLNGNITSACVGGIQGYVPAGARILSNSFQGEINLGGGATNLNAGGLYGYLKADTRTFDFANDMSVMMGTVNVESYASSTSTRVFAGGMIGSVEKGSTLTVKGFEVLTNFLVKQEKDMTSDFLCTGGILGGSDPSGASTINLESIANRGNHRAGFNTSMTSKGLNFCMGGVAGYVCGPLTVSNCSNEAVIGDGTVATNASAKSNDHKMIAAGIVGQAEGGNAVFTKCVNSGSIQNAHYCNNPYTTVKSERVICDVTAGVLGAFEYKGTPGSSTLKMEACENNGTIQSYRGLCAGIVGWGVNATINKCVCAGNLGGNKMSGVSGMDNNSAYVAGIAAAIGGKSAITLSSVRTALHANSPGSEIAEVGGIVAVDLGGCAISGSEYFGAMDITTIKDGTYFGGIIGQGTSSSSVTECKWGGNYCGTTITENNFKTYAIGNKTGKTENNTYWDGK